MTNKARELAPGVRVRYIGEKYPFKNPVLLLLVGRTGVIKAPSQIPGLDWDVEMDEGAYSLDAAAEGLIPIDDDEADNWGEETESQGKDAGVSLTEPAGALLSV